MLAQYERACAALAKATRIDQVLPLRDEIEHVKLYAKRIRDRDLLTDATVFQMRCERRLGVLLVAAKEAGELADKGRPKVSETGFKPATLSEIGVDLKLSSRAQKAAAVDADEFEVIIRSTREKMAAGKAIIVDPVDQAVKQAKVDQRRADHAARTLNGGTVKDLHKLAASGYRAGAILMDPAWLFMARSAAGEGRSANVHYTTENIDAMKALPVEALAADNCGLFMWMVDWCPQDALDLIKHYGFTHKTTALTWVKQNESGQGWHMGQGYWTRANPEACWLATRGNPKRLYADVQQLIVSPVMEHSRKPDEQYERIERLIAGPYLELQARRPRKGWTSWGNELEFTGVAA